MTSDLQRRETTGSPAQLSQKFFVTYLLASLAWILASDVVVRMFDVHGRLDVIVDLSRGFFFVVILGLVIRRLTFKGLSDIDDARRSWMEANFELVRRLAHVAEHRDDLTGQHGQRISQYSTVLAKELGYDDATSRLLGAAASLHDLGKIGVSDAVLLKPGALTLDERREMERHVFVGAELLADGSHPLVRLAHSVALTHHENWDGSGYPLGLVGREIPVEGRIVAICDVFDALVSKRAYKPAWSIEEAVDEIRREAGTKFDPAVAAAFARCAKDFAEIAGQQLPATSMNEYPKPESILPPLAIDQARARIGGKVCRDESRPRGSEGVIASLGL